MNNKVYFAASIVEVGSMQICISASLTILKRQILYLQNIIGKSNMSLKAQTLAIDTRIYERDTAWLKSCDLLIA